MKYTRTTIRTAVRKQDFSDFFCLKRYSLAPYSGCEHNCLYCDGRAEKYYVQGDFGRDITIRENIPDLLAAQLPKLREKGFIGIGSGVTDAYQPIEKKAKLTRRCAELISESGRPAVLLTKSSLILRDLDIWQTVNKNSCFIPMVSIQSADPEVIRRYEPEASPLEERIEALREFKKAECATGILAMPFLPGISDSEKNIRALYELALELRVDFLIPGHLTLRPGIQKETFLNALDPELLPVYRDIYRENRQSGNTTDRYRDSFYSRWSGIRKNFPLPGFVPHRLYRDQLEQYDGACVLLNHMEYLYRERGRDVSRLRNAARNLREWLLVHKRKFNRRRSLAPDYVDTVFRQALETEELTPVLENGKLEKFLKDIVLKKSVFNYTNLKRDP